MAGRKGDLRRLETALARFTLCGLAVYFPLETWSSLGYGLLDPFYLVDLVAMVLMAWGAQLSLSARPACAPALLCAAYAWASANGWRATAWRVAALRTGESLDHGPVEAWIVGVGSSIALAGFGLALFLVLRDVASRR